MIAIWQDWLYRLDVPLGSVVAATYDASLIDLDDWVILCDQAGGEAALMAALGVMEVSDGRVA